MKKIILDYFCRWWWVWILGAVAQSIICWFTVSTAEAPSNFLFFPYAYFIGAFPLFFDLRHGHTRAILTLPVSIKRVALAWRLLAIGVPALMLASFGFLSAGISFLCHTNGNFHFEWLEMNCVFDTLWLGASFFILTGLNTGVATNWWEQTRNSIFGALWGLSIGGGFLFCQNIAQNHFKMNLMLILGSVLSVAGWFRAEYLVRQRAGFRSASQPPAKRPAQYKISKGFNGIPLLLTLILTRTLLIWLGMTAFMAFFAVFQGQATSPEKFFHDTVPVITNGFTFWFIIVIQTFPILTHLRLLRTLPLSSTNLAILLIALPVLSMLTLAVALMALVISVAGVEKGFETAENMLIPTVFVAWCIPLAVWQGFNRQTMYMMMFVLFLGVTTSLQFFSYGKISLSLSSSLLVSAFLIIAAVWLTKRLLIRSRNAYRSWPNPLAKGWGWNWGR